MKPYEVMKPAQTPTKYGRCERCGYTLGNHDNFRCWRRTHCDCGAEAVQAEEYGEKLCGECEKPVDECFCDQP